jgi:tRNA U34 5-carboxymethylaminomethyl modifying enzyme MnmG/GidA
MTDLEESQRVTVERLQKEIEVWKTKYYDQIKTDEEWERYIEKSREEAQRLSKQKATSWVLGFLWILLVIYEIFF